MGRIEKESESISSRESSTQEVSNTGEGGSKQNEKYKKDRCVYMRVALQVFISTCQCRTRPDTREMQDKA